MYGIIFEHKAEGPLIMEGHPISYEEAVEKMAALVDNPRIIRVAIFKLTYETGNETLISEGE